MQTLKKANQLFSARTKRNIVLLFLNTFLLAQVEMLTLASIQPFIMILTEPSIIYTNRWVNMLYNAVGAPGLNPFLAFLAIGVAGLYAIRGLYVYFTVVSQNRFTARNKADMSNRILIQILKKPYLYHAQHNTAKIQREIMGNTDRLFSWINSVLALLSDVFMSSSILLFLMSTSPDMTLSVLGMAGVSMVVYFALLKNKIKAVGDDEERGMVAINKTVLQTLGGVKEIKVNNKEDFFTNKFRHTRLQTIKHQERIQSLRQLPKLFIESLCFSGGFVVVAFSLLAGADRWELIPQLGVFVMAGFKLLPAISRMVNTITQILRLQKVVHQVHDLLFETETLDIDYTHRSETTATNADIAVENLTFQYPKGKKPVLKNVSLTIKEHSSVALVGPSGAGKSTLIDVILGVLAPQSGAVVYQGQSIHHHFETFTEQIGYIPQSIYLLDETLRDNIAFGIAPEAIDDTQVWLALEQAQLKEFVEELPDGLDAQIGERGVRLSGGQRQRIGIARALYRNPSILVLDEATSSLDTATETEVMESIKRLQGDKTIIIVTHRLSTVEHCDVIYRVEKGRVKQTTFEKLSAQY